MKLTLEGLREQEYWGKAGIGLPVYDVEKSREEARKNPKWVHFGVGNIFRIFLGGIADKLLEKGEMDSGIICVETFDYDVIDRIYVPHDNLALSVILHENGTVERKVLGSLSEAIKAQYQNKDSWEHLKAFWKNGRRMQPECSGRWRQISNGMRSCTSIC